MRCDLSCVAQSRFLRDWRAKCLGTLHVSGHLKASEGSAGYAGTRGLCVFPSGRSFSWVTAEPRKKKLEVDRKLRTGHVAFTVVCLEFNYMVESLWFKASGLGHPSKPTGAAFVLCSKQIE